MNKGEFLGKIEMKPIGDGKLECALYKKNMETREYENIPWPEGKSINEAIEEVVASFNDDIEV